jgi:cyclic pyranopterin phosphate synthase
LTAEGHLRGCLFSDREVDIKTPLRGGAADEELLALIDLSIKSKGEEHGHVEHRLRKCVRQMSSIGG